MTRKLIGRMRRIEKIDHEVRHELGLVLLHPVAGGRDPIDPDSRYERFEPFQQADNSYARRYTGTGLGLTISKELARAMGGDVSAQSEPGHGSIFTLELPWQPSVPPRPDNRPAKTAVTQSLRGRVLLAEDNPVNVLVARAMLEGFGLDVAVAVNGELAVESYRANRPDIVLMDCHMPRMDGFTATARIRELERNASRRTPIVALTAGVTPEERAKCLAAGMDDFVAKPIVVAALAASLGRWTACPILNFACWRTMRR